MYDREQHLPSKATANRAAEIWKRMLRDPKYDAVGDSHDINELVYKAKSKILTDALTNNVTEERLKVFGDELVKHLLTPDEQGFVRSYLDVDYHPDPTLKECADKAGLKIEFPYKTCVNVLRDYVSVSYGYGAENIYHYPLKDGSWLVTALCGTDIAKVIELAEGGCELFKPESVEAKSND